MPICAIRDIRDRIRPGSRLLGLDIGEKTIGLAISDPMLSLASPITTIRRKKFTRDVLEMAEIIKAERVGGLIIGLPVNMDGSEGPRCQSVRHFGDNLIKQSALIGGELPIAFWDERLSTSAVERFLVDEADMTRKRRGEVVDKMAAAWILQGALDSLG